MPEVNFSPTADADRKFSIRSNGIGDSDAFPLFDNGSDDEIYAHPEEEKWGFRITGGAEFKMPVVVFQVTEGGLAAENGIKLGDVILKINRIDASSLTLSEARKIIQQAEYSLELLAKKMEDENEMGGDEKMIVLKPAIELGNLEPPRAHIQERLATLQRKLKEIAEIPMLLQSTLETVSKTVECVVCPETQSEDTPENYPDSLRDETETIDSDLSDDTCEECSYADSLEIYESSPEQDNSQYEQTDEDDLLDDQEAEDNLPEVECSSKVSTPEPTEEDLLKQERKEKIQRLEDSWPWESRKKIIHKFSNCRIVPSVSIVQERIQHFSTITLSGRIH